MTEAPLRILLLTTSLMRGGAETQVFLLAAELARRGHDVHVVSMRDAEAYEPELRAIGIPVTSLGMRRGVPDVRAMFTFAALVRKLRPDVVHSHMVHANLLARLTRILAPMPVLISTAHSVYEGGGWRDVAYRITDSLASLTTNVCEAGVRRFVSVGAVPSPKIRCVVNGLQPSPFERDEGIRLKLRKELGIEDRFVWIAVGALEAVKDYPLMFDAFVEVSRLRPDATLLVVSDGPDRGSLERLRSELGLGSGQVHFLGSRSDVAHLMSAADGYIMTSKWEGLPMVLLEASVAQLPIVTTRVGGTDEVIHDEETGFLVDSREPSVVAKAMLRVMAYSNEVRQALGTRARKHVLERFHIAEVVSTWMTIYQEFLDRRR